MKQDIAVFREAALRLRVPGGRDQSMKTLGDIVSTVTQKPS